MALFFISIEKYFIMIYLVMLPIISKRFLNEWINELMAQFLEMNFHEK